MNRTQVLIKNWSIVTDDYNKPTKLRLQGNVIGHASFPDETPVSTSTIIDIIDYGAHKIVETRNTLYKILPENVDPEYEERFPDAYNRLKG